jgi:hypothetical protein
LALVSDGVEIDASDMTTVSAALSKQVQRDFQPIWDVDATVDSFVNLEDVPTDYWPIIVMRNVKGAGGYHQDKNGQPFAVVQFGPQWSLTASHECLEMLADPFGGRLVAADLLDQALDTGMDPSRVQYLVEVCDPSESADFSYTVNGVKVSDFYTPQFFDPVQSEGVRYSFRGTIDGPRKVLDGGYISWQDLTTGEWSQLRMFPDQFSQDVPHILNLSRQTNFEALKESEGIRGAIDRVTGLPHHHYKEKAGKEALAAVAIRDHSREACRARANNLRSQIGKLMG